MAGLYVVFHYSPSLLEWHTVPFSLLGEGIDDYEFILSFETDHPEDFLNLVMDLRTTEASKYTALETPIFTCLNVDPEKMLDLLGP